MPFASKYRHVYGDKPKNEGCFLDIPKPYTSGEGAYCIANEKFWAVSKAGGGGPICVHPHAKTGRGPYYTVSSTKGKALDFKFHPFIPNLLGCSSEDCSAVVYEIPAEGLTENLSGDPMVLLKGHLKKCHLMNWHPTANNIMVTSAWDKTIKLWNVETSSCVETFTGMKEPTFSLEFNKDGSLLGATTKAKNVVIFDPRSNEVAFDFPGFTGTKSSKLFWVDNFGWVGATGFNKQAKRELKLWDLKKPGTPIFADVMDQQSSILMPTYDEDTNVLYLAGKGDGSVTYQQLVNDKRMVYQLGSYRDTEPQKGGSFLPKKGLDTSRCEVMRYMKLTKNAVIPISFMVPRKTGAEIFQADIFPDCKAGLPSMTADEYLKGENKDPITMSMDPEKRTDESSGAVKFEKKATYAELAAENDQLKKRIADLESQLGTVESGEDAKEES